MSIYDAHRPFFTTNTIQRIATITAVWALLILTGLGDETPEPKKSSAFDDSPTEQASPLFDELKKEFSAAQAKHNNELKAAQKAVSDASSDTEKQQAQHRLDNLKNNGPGPKFADRFLAFAEEHPADERAFTAAMLAFNNGRAPATRDNIRGQAITFLQHHYAAKPQIRQLVRVFENNHSPAGESLLREALAKNPNHRIQGHACKALISITTKPAEKERLEKLMKGKYADMFPDLSIGKPVPEIVAKNLQGQDVKLSKLRGKVVVLDFWATWCPHCRAMFPHEREMVERLKHKPFAIVGISMDAKKEALVKLMDKEKLPWNNWWVGAHSDVAEDWAIEYFPTVYVIDAHGIIRNHGINGKELDDAVDQLLKKMETRPEGKKKSS